MKREYVANGKKVVLEVDEDVVALRYRPTAPMSLRASSVAGAKELGSFTERFEVPGEEFTIVNVAQTASPRSVRHKAAVDVMARSSDVDRVAPVFKVGDSRVIATDRLLIGLADDVDRDALFKKHDCEVIEEATPSEVMVRIAPSLDPLEVVEKLSGEPGVEYAEPDFVTIGRHVARRSDVAGPASSDPLEPKQYAYKLTQAHLAWSRQQGSPSVRIAILDEGVDTRHEDLKEAIAGAYDGTDGDTYQEPRPWDAHGTACAGLAGAIQGNNKGVVGIGAGCSLLAVRIAYSSGPHQNWITNNSWIRRAIDWSWSEGKADILSNSWGGGAPSTAITNAFRRARTKGRDGKGCVVVVAAGNDSRPVDFPGNLEGVLTVSASNEYDEPKTKTSQDGESWWGSNFGPSVDVAAPGVHNYTTDISGSSGYNSGGSLDSNYVHNFNGTSSACPIVAGAAGLLLSAKPDLTEAEVREVIKTTADKVGSVVYVNGRNDQMGSGRVNVLRAVEAVLERTELTGLVKRAGVEGMPVAPAYVLVSGGELFLLHTFQGMEALPWEVLEQQSLDYLSQFENQEVTIQFARRHRSTYGTILWGVTVSSPGGMQ